MLEKVSFTKKLSVNLEVIQGVQMNRAALTGGCCSHGWVTGLSAAGE